MRSEIAQKPDRFVSLKKGFSFWALVCSMFVAGTSFVNARPFALSETFTAGRGISPGNPIWVPVEPEETFSFWRTVAPEQWIWQGTEKEGSGYEMHPLHPKGYSGAQALQPWIYRSLADGNPSTTALRNPIFRADVAMRWGDNTSSGLAWVLALLNSDGKGYVAEVARSGRVALFRVDGSVTDPDGWVQIATGQGDPGNRQVLSFSVIDGQVRLNSSSRRGIIAAAEDRAYDVFTDVALSSFVNGGVFMVVYAVSVEGES